MIATEAITTAIEDFLRLLHEPGHAFEIRIPKAGRAGTVSGYYTDHAKAAADIVKRDGKVPGIYVTLNPVDSALMARSANRLKERAADTTSDRDVVRRRRLLIDVDFTRPAGISATDEELNAAGRKAQQVKAFLEDECGWPEGILVHSGNGAHLLYLIDLPNDDESCDLVKQVLVALAKKFDEGGVHVDTSVFNAARIVKVAGTMACKGDDLPERPHRRSRIVEQPEQAACVPRSALEALAGPPKAKGKGSPAPRGNGSGTSFDVEEFMAQHALAVRQHKQDAGADTWELAVCPVNSEHDHGEAFVRRAADGVLSAGCQHQSCTWMWADLRAMFDPGYRERVAAAGVTPYVRSQDIQGVASPDTLPATLTDPPAAAAGPFHLTELGNAERLAARHGKHIRAVRGIGLKAYDAARGTYVDEHARLVRYASDTVRSVYHEAGDDMSSRADALRKHAKASETKRAHDAMLALAESLESLEAEVSDFDADPDLLNTPSGVVNLRSGDMHPHDPKYRMTKVAGCGYAPGIATPLWTAFLDRIFAGDAELIAFMQRLFGYTMTGRTGERLFAIFHGEGGNGKSRLLDAWHDALGDYATVTGFGTFSPQRTDAIRNDLAALAGRRLVTTSETRHGQTLDEVTVKQTTGGDEIAARFLHKEWFTYAPQFQVVMSTNQKPVIRFPDQAIKDRVLLVPFAVTIPMAERDPDLREKLRGEVEGVLAWGVAGAVDYLAHGLRIPAGVRAATDEYRDEMDPWYGFREECMLDAGAWTPTAVVRSMLKKWVDDEPGKDMPNHNELADLCKRMGAEPVKRHNVRGWRGIGFDHVETEQSLPMGDE